MEAHGSHSSSSSRPQGACQAHLPIGTQQAPTSLRGGDARATWKEAPAPVPAGWPLSHPPPDRHLQGVLLVSSCLVRSPPSLANERFLLFVVFFYKTLVPCMHELVICSQGLRGAPSRWFKAQEGSLCSRACEERRSPPWAWASGQARAGHTDSLCSCSNLALPDLPRPEAPLGQAQAYLPLRVLEGV